ncbi:MAG: hypothetical protein HOB26_00190 [Flavobacteriales bacterium]|jgi:hypothetical protein|nr:hypothetical protein [Flavobacteriales bacterium]
MEPLFELVKSMNQGEKRYFKRMGTLRSEFGSSNYIKLFDTIEKSKKYNEKKLILQFGKKFFAQNKRHLFTKILETLRTMHDTHSIEMQVRHSISEAEILTERSLFSSAKHQIKSARKRAEKHELFLEQVRINSTELEVLSRENDLNNLNERIEEYKKLNKIVSDKIENQLLFEELYSALVELNQRIELVRSEPEEKSLQTVMAHPLLSNVNRALSLKSKNHYFYIHGLAHFFLGEFSESLKYFRQQLILINRNNWIGVNKLTSLKSMGNVCLLCIKTNDKHGYGEAYAKLEKYSATSLYEKQYYWYLTYLIKLLSFDSISQNNNAIAFVEENLDKTVAIKKWIREHDTMHLEYCYSTFKTVEVFMFNKSPRKALRYINEFLNNADAELKQDTYCIARIINLLIHFELENVELLENEIKSAHRYLSHRDRIYGFEQSILKFLNKAINLPANENYKMLWTILNSDWNKLQNDRFEKQVFQYFDFMRWLELKMDNK